MFILLKFFFIVFPIQIDRNLISQSGCYYTTAEEKRFYLFILKTTILFFTDLKLLWAPRVV